MYLNQTIAAGVRLEYTEALDYIYILSAPGGADLSLEFYRKGALVGNVENIGAGYAEKFLQPIDKFIVVSAGGQAVSLVTRLGAEIRNDTPPNGAVTVTNNNGAFTNAAKTVTSASATLVAANAGRRYLLIQNNDASGDIHVRLDGTAATTATGVKIAAGQSYELQGYAPTGAVTAIGSIASNANIVVVEG